MDDDLDLPGAGEAHDRRHGRRHHWALEREARREARALRRKSRQPTPEERAYRDARRRANAKLGFLIHLVVYSTVCLGLFLVGGFRAAVATGAFWGVGLAVHYVSAIWARDLRQRWIDQEVRRQVHSTAARQRVELRDQHARHLEELSASIAHEIRNPITAAKSLVQQLGEDPAAAENVEYARVALDELDRVERSISHLLRFARDEDLQLRPMRMADVVDSALDTFAERLARHGVTLHRQVDEAGTMQGDPEKLRRALLNLVSNALDALAQAAVPEPRIEVHAGENLAGTEVWLRVRDNGPGVPPELLDRIFSPFYTGKADGTGLGLALTRKVVDAHGGRIEASSQPGAGTEFLLTFPKRGAPGEAR